MLQKIPLCLFMLYNCGRKCRSVSLLRSSSKLVTSCQGDIDKRRTRREGKREKVRESERDRAQERKREGERVSN